MIEVHRLVRCWFRCRISENMSKEQVNKSAAVLGVLLESSKVSAVIMFHKAQFRRHPPKTLQPAG